MSRFYKRLYAKETFPNIFRNAFTTFSNTLGTMSSVLYIAKLFRLIYDVFMYEGSLPPMRGDPLPSHKSQVLLVYASSSFIQNPPTYDS